MPVTDFADMMPFTLTHQAVSSYNSNGKPTHSATLTSYRCRVSYTAVKTVSKRAPGEDVLASPVAWVMGVIPGLTVDDLITLPDGTQPLIVNFDMVPDEVENHHHKIYFRGNR